MQIKHSRGANPILVYLAVLLLIVNAVFLGTLFLRDNDPIPASATLIPVSPTPAITASTPQTTDTMTAPVKLAWFYNLPKNNQEMLLIANWFDVLILIQGNEDKRDLVRSMGVTGPVLQYLEFEAIQDPGSCTDDPEVNQVTYPAGDFCTISNQHPDWFLLDQQGMRISVMDDDNTWYLMDPGNPGWRNFFLDRVRQFQPDPK